MRYAIILSINIQTFAKNSRFSAEYKLFSGTSNFFQASKCKFAHSVLHFMTFPRLHAAARCAVENRRICIREFAESWIPGKTAVRKPGPLGKPQKARAGAPGVGLLPVSGSLRPQTLPLCAAVSRRPRTEPPSCAYKRFLPHRWVGGGTPSAAAPPFGGHIFLLQTATLSDKMKKESKIHFFCGKALLSFLHVAMMYT